MIQHCGASGKSGVPWMLDCLGDSVTRSGAFATVRDHLWIALGGAALVLAPLYVLLHRIHYKKRQQAERMADETPDVRTFFKKDSR